MARPQKISREDKLLLDVEKSVRSIRENPNDYNNLWTLLWLGHVVFKQGLGLPVCSVEAAIEKGLTDEEKSGE